ncbi:reverse transcriptase domain-containing protein, partial [Tanacetum coccineum]
RFYTSAGNPIKEILLKLNLPDHKSILMDLKLKNFKKDKTLKLFKSTNQERYEHVSLDVTSSQDGKVYKMAKRDYAGLMISRFRIPATTITNNGTQLINDPFKYWADGLGIQLVSTSVYHPQANGAVEWANQSIMQGINTRLHQEGGAWVEELPNVLWAHKTTPKKSNRETPFSLAYGTEAVIPAEIGIPIKRMIQGYDEENEEALRLNLNLLKERREIATIREARRKQQVKKYYNQRVCHKQFKVREFVLRKNKLSKVENTGKLGPKWEGPHGCLQASVHGRCRNTTHMAL